MSTLSGVGAALLLLSVLPAAPAAWGGGDEPGIDAAGCLIATPDGFVMALNRLLGRLQLPAGRYAAGESARDTAARETFEETGIKVEVGDVALRVDGDRVLFFHCAPRDATIDYDALSPVDRVEVSRAFVVNPITNRTPRGELVKTPWRFPEMRWLLRSVFPSVAGVGAD